ncbi:hypothetical protein [Francisella uliginis]|uniref:Thaumarchaeal output domain-containing protein n=1 Tax=Francisella uliginis TaxID=573570 RepID=A0A1L4BSX4_9GAMM|nr:hypothetical protein [Francisella uliginis]API86938.1 hypothetical protein F7310_06020 [Francisella uliginis]
MSRDLNLAILETSSLEVRDKLSEFSIKEFSKTNAFFSREFENIDAFVIDYNYNASDLSAFEVVEIIKKIRSSVYTYLKPIFCNSCEYVDYTMEKFSTTDELIKFVETINHEIDNIIKIIRNINDISNGWQTRLLIYLCTRKSIRGLIPHKNKSRNTCYSYPTLDMFSQDDEFDYYEWIKELKDQNILKAKKLIKSFFYCSNCPSSHVLFSKRCPECHSEDIIVGADSKQPDNYSCRECESIFVEPEVVNECVDCGTITFLEQMRKQNIFEYVLTTKAEQNIKTTILQDPISVYDDIDYTIPEFFYSFVDWAYSMQKRNPEYEFSLMHINIFDYIGTNDIEAISKALKSILRKTDLLTKVSPHDIWLWLPNTSLEGAEVVVKMIKDAHLSEKDTVEDLVEINVFHSKSLEDFSSAERFLQGLSAKE